MPRLLMDAGWMLVKSEHDEEWGGRQEPFTV